MTAASLSYREHLPAPGLRRLVARYWSLEAGPSEGHRVLPDGCMDLLFDLTGAEEAGVVGVMTRAIVTPKVPRAWFFGVRFQPGEAFAFVDVPAHEGTDKVVPLADAWGRVGRELHDRVLSAKDTEARVALLDRELAARRRTASDPRVRSVVAQIRAARGGVRVPALAASVGVGERQLERLFDERVGVSPKSLAKVVRMHALLGAATARDDSLSTLAADFGWADQSHLARDLRALAGVTPGELVQELRMSDSSNTAGAPLVTTGP